MMPSRSLLDAPPGFVLLLALCACSHGPATGSDESARAVDAGPAPAATETEAARVVRLAKAPTRSVPMAKMKSPRDGHTATLLPSGKVLVIGGENFDRDMLASVELYDPDANTWQELAPLSSTRCNHSASLLGDGTVLVVGGGKTNGIGLPSGEEVRDDAVIYDPSSGKSQSAGKTTVSRHGHGAAQLPSGKILIVGGANGESAVKPAQGAQNPQPFGSAIADAEVFDPATKKFTAVGSLAQARYAFSMVTLPDGRVLVSGGASYAAKATSYATSELFDEKTNAFSDAGTFDGGSDRLFATATMLEDGRVMVYGGKKSNVAFLDDSQLYDPAAGTWSAGPDLTPARTLPILIGLEGGGAVALGGYMCTSGCSASRDVRIWNGRKVVDGPTLLQSRTLASATVLADGSILLVGGYGNATTNTVERLSP